MPSISGRSFRMIIAASCIVLLFAMQGCYNRPVAPQNLRIIFTSDTRGYITPCGTLDGLRGGIGRRSTAVREAIDTAPGPVILLDTGNFTTGSTSELELIRIDYVARAMTELGYDAVNVGLLDACRDRIDLLEISNQGLPLTSAAYTFPNAETGESESSYPEKIILEREGFPIAIVGSHLSDDAANQPLGAGNEPTIDGFELLEMINNLYALDGVGMVILISDMASSWEQSRITASIFPLAAVVIAGQPAPPDFTEENRGADIVHPVAIPHAAAWGRSLGILDLELSRTGGVIAYHVEYVDLSDEIEGDPRFDELIGEYLDAINAPPPGLDLIDTAVYAGSEACRECHPSEYEDWLSKRHSDAWLDVERSGNLRDSTCSPCHITGYTSVQWLPEDLVPMQLAGVGCEACHGPGQTHIAAQSGSSGENAPDSIVRQPSEATCIACHVGPWDEGWLFETKYDRVRHE